MAKRGQLVFIAIITLVVALFVGVMYPKIAKAYASGEVTLKVVAAKDIALTIDTIYAYPYDIEVEYDVDLSKFVVEISQNDVKVKKPGIDSTAGEYRFVSIGNDDPSTTLNNPKKIIFSKEGSELTITGVP